MLPIKTVDIELALMREFEFTKNTIVTGVTAGNLAGFETDLLCVSKSGYAHAFEIKVSKSDLIRDLKKKHIKLSQDNPSSHFKMLKYFSYAVPEYLKDEALSIIPKFAGLFTLEITKPDHFPDGHYRKIMTQIRAPKKINNYKWSTEQIMSLLRLGNLRNYNFKRKMSCYEKH